MQVSMKMVGVFVSVITHRLSALRCNSLVSCADWTMMEWKTPRSITHTLQLEAAEEIIHLKAKEKCLIDSNPLGIQKVYKSSWCLHTSSGPLSRFSRRIIQFYVSSFIYRTVIFFPRQLIYHKCIAHRTAKGSVELGRVFELSRAEN